VPADRTIRIALWCSVALNFFGLLVFGSGAIGRPSPLLAVPIAPFYAAQLTLMIGLFGAAYAWLALQPTIDVPLLVFGAVGKIAFFSLFVLFWILGDLTWQTAAEASPDLLLGLVYLWWVRWATKRPVTSRPRS
jgi:hypothetical protein